MNLKESIQKYMDAQKQLVDEINAITRQEVELAKRKRELLEEALRNEGAIRALKALLENDKGA